jgi:hypothetical protein
VAVVRSTVGMGVGVGVGGRVGDGVTIGEGVGVSNVSSVEGEGARVGKGVSVGVGVNVSLDEGEGVGVEDDEGAGECCINMKAAPPALGTTIISASMRAIILLIADFDDKILKPISLAVRALMCIRDIKKYP